MKRKSYKYYVRIAHRYLGIFIGIQFVFWTVGGLYFSWTNIEEIRGEHLRQQSKKIDFAKAFVSPQLVIEKLKSSDDVAKISEMRMVQISGEPFYEFSLKGDDKKERFIIADAVSGEIRPQLSEKEARKIAAESLKSPLDIQSAVFLTEENVGGHHEYREKPLPAWGVTFEGGLTVYLSAETGQIGAYRTNNWRVFDFLWMLHTMDFYNRDDINNYVLRAFSILGLITLLSGFLLFFATPGLFSNRLRMVKSSNSSGSA